MTSQKPNILLIVTDQHMVSSIGAYGSRICQTPNIDQLAREGVVFSNSYTSCPVCTPARASIQTGLYPFKHGMQTNIYTRGCMVHELPDSPSLLSRRLQSLGYRCGYTGKWHLGFGNDPADDPEYDDHLRSTPIFAEGFSTHGSLPTDLGYEGDDFPGHGSGGMRYARYRDHLRENGITLELEKHRTRYPAAGEIRSGVESTVPRFLGDRAIGLIDTFSESGAPFFTMLNFWGPHEPYYVATEYLDRYRNVSIPPWPSFTEPQEGKPSVHNAQRFLQEEPWSEYERLLRYYYASVTAIDAEIGRVVQVLKDKNIYENTAIIFTADHGESLGVHNGLTDKSFFLYEETCRVPLVIKPAGPTLSARTEAGFTGTCDLYPTILETAGLPREESERDGRSLVPLLRADTQTVSGSSGWRDTIVTESSGLDFVLVTQRMIRYRSWKYIFTAGDIDELYDLDQDPHELTNLATSRDHETTLTDMRTRLARWMEENNDGLLERYCRIRRVPHPAVQ